MEWAYAMIDDRGARRLAKDAVGLGEEAALS